MKTTIKVLLVSVLLLLSTGCKKDFLDAQPSGGEISDDTIERLSKIPSVASDITAGFAKELYTWMYTPEAGGLVKNHMDYGQKSVDLAFDIIAGDFVKTTDSYGWHSSLQRYQDTTDKNMLMNYMPWRYYYRLIYTANNIIDAYGGDSRTFTTEDSPADRHAMGQALAMRGHSYFYLIQAYSAEYEPTKDLVPVYRSKKDIDKPVATQKEVYDLVIADLTKAAELLADFSRDGKYQISADVAKTFLAYLYGMMGNYVEVERLTSEIINSGRYSVFTAKDICYTNMESANNTYYFGLPTKESGFGDIKLPGVMWGIDMNPEMNVDLASYWGTIDLFTYSYAFGDPRNISDVLYAKIRPDDIRKQQFQDVSWAIGPGYELMPINKFYHKERTVDTQRKIEADLIYTRYDEVVLLNAEAKAMLGKDAEAKAVLKDYLATRIEDVTYIDALAGDQLKDEIFLQTRIEFVGEGRALFAMRRFKKEVQLGTNRFDPENQGKTVKYNESKMYFKIPENEEINNPNLYKK